MQRNTKILAATCAALALTASLAFAAGPTGRPDAAENAADSWTCPGAQYGHAAFERTGYGCGGCMGYRSDRPDSRFGRRMGPDAAGRGGYDRDASPRTVPQNRNL